MALISLGGTYKTYSGETITILSHNATGFLASNGRRYTITGLATGTVNSDMYDIVEELPEAGSTYASIPLTYASGPEITPDNPSVTNPTSISDPTRTPSRHAEIIKKWAEGYTIQYRGPRMDHWEDLLPPGQSNVTWGDSISYRVKPEILELFCGIVRSVREPGLIYTTVSKTSVEQIRDLIPAERLLGIIKIRVDPETGAYISTETIPIS